MTFAHITELRTRCLRPAYGFKFSYSSPASMGRKRPSSSGFKLHASKPEMANIKAKYRSDDVLDRLTIPPLQNRAFREHAFFCASFVPPSAQR